MINFKLINIIVLLSIILIYPFNIIAQNHFKPIGYYPFSGNANDESGFNKHASVHGATLTYDRFGKANSAYYFDGFDDYIIVNKSNRLNYFPVTISAWVKPEKRKNIVAFFGNSYSYHKFPNNVISNDNPYRFGHGFGINIWDDGAEVVTEYSDGFNHIPFTPKDNAWYFVAVSYDFGKYSLFINGELVQSVEHNQGNVDGLNHILIGMHNDDFDGWSSKVYFKGIIDDINIYNAALNENQIADIYKSSLIPPAKPQIKVACRVIDAKTEKNISGALVSVMDKHEITGIDGICYFTLDEGTIYNFFCKSNGYKSTMKVDVVHSFTKLNILLVPDNSKNISTALNGQIVDAISKTPLVSTILLEGDNKSLPIKTDNDGKFRIEITAGIDYDLKISSAGYHEKTDVVKAKLGEEVNQVYLLNSKSKNDISALKNTNNVFSNIKLGSKIDLTIQFEQSQAKILPESIPILDSLLSLLIKRPTLEIELFGYTDNVGIDSLNLKLSNNRVLEIKKFLIRNGINQYRISGRGYGSSNPIASNNEEAGRRRNRRVEMQVIKE